MKCICLFVFISFLINAKGQKERFPLEKPGDWNIYLAKAPGVYTYRVDSATAMIENSVLPNGAIRLKNYSLTGSLLSFADYGVNPENQKRILHGLVAKYGSDGIVDSTGSFVYGRREGNWYAYNDSAKIISKAVYKDGKLISVEKKIPQTKKEQEEEGKKCKTCKDAEYNRGGSVGWKQYIANTCTPTERYKNLPESQGRGKITALVTFVIGTNGKVEDVYPLKSVEWSMDKKIVDAIFNGGDWIPSEKDGKPVKAYRMQPVTIVLKNK